MLMELDVIIMGGSSVSPRDWGTLDLGDFEYKFFSKWFVWYLGKSLYFANNDYFASGLDLSLVVWTDWPTKFNKIKLPGVLNPIVCNKLILYSVYLKFLEVTQKISTVESLCRLINIPVLLFPVSFWTIVLVYYHRTVYYHHSGALDVNVP